MDFFLWHNYLIRLAVEQYYAALIGLLEKLPHYRSSENLAELERVANDYERILDEVHGLNDYFKHQTNDYIRKVGTIEADLHSAKYGTSEKQREAAFKHAKQSLYNAIDALATVVQNGPQPNENPNLLTP